MSLTQTAYTSRRIIKFGGISLIGIVLLWNITVFLAKVYKNSHPEYVPPTIGYGILPKITFIEKKYEQKNFIFELPNDEIPKFEDQSRVYVIYRPNTTFLSLEEDKKTAAGFGFTSQPIEAEGKPGLYMFLDNTLNKTLTVNVLSGDFELKYPYLSDQLLLTVENLPTKNQAIEIAGDFLSRGNKLTESLINGEKKVSYWKIQDGIIKAVKTPEEANAVRVDIFRDKINNLKVLSSNFDRATVSVLISASKSEGRKIIEFNFKDIVFNKESYETYPIKTTTEAIESIKSGNFWTAIDVQSTDVVIRKIYLAYFEPHILINSNFLQPIYVFEGDDGFVAYVPAIKSEYFK